jgi:hypothetical protein
MLRDILRSTLVATSLLAFVVLPSPLKADPIVAESDSGIVFGDLSCKTDKLEGVERIVFNADPFDYLGVRVTVRYTCITRDGRRWRRTGTDAATFSTLDFNWELQRWETGQDWVALRRGGWIIELNEKFTPFVWTAVDPDGSIVFKVQFKKAPETPQPSPQPVAPESMKLDPK